MRVLRQVALALGLLVPTSAFAADGPSKDDPDDDGLTNAEEKELGLDPSVANIPEPLYYDMIGGLDARPGEIELNVLAEYRGGNFRGGYEIEYTFARGVGLEVDLNASTAGIEGWQGNLEFTLPTSRSSPFQHGVLIGNEYLLGNPQTPTGRTSGVYVAAVRLSQRWTALTMLGGRATAVRRGRTHVGGIWNPSVFFDATSRVTVGLEMSSVLDEDGTTDLVLLPQAHWQPARSWRFQVGSGLRVDETGTSMLSVLRVSLAY